MQTARRLTSMSRLTFLLLACLPVSLVADETPDLGKRVVGTDVEHADYVVMPNGEGLPEGAGTAEDGRVLYDTHCVACHGSRGAGGINDRLAGGHGTLTGDQPQKTVGSYWPYATTLFDYIRRAMPYQAPGTLTDDEIYALTAYILHINEIVAENERMDADSLPAVQMPNSANFVWSYTP